MSQQNKGLGKITIVDGEHGAEGNHAGGNVLDPNNPILQPAKETPTKKKTWKRKLIGWSAILLLIGAGVGALYLLLRVNRVNVTVNADSRRNAQSTKPQNEVTNSDSHLTADAINIARSAAGADANTQPAIPLLRFRRLRLLLDKIRITKLISRVSHQSLTMWARAATRIPTRRRKKAAHKQRQAH